MDLKKSGAMAVASAFSGAEASFAPFRGKRVFITGGTGFFGKWLLLAFAFANAKWGMDVKVASLSRNPSRFLKAFPEFAGLPDVELIAGDVRTFELPGAKFDFIMHAATEASAKLERENPEEMRSVIVEGTKRALAFARESGASRFLDISSGGVYGRQPAELERIPEDFPCAPFTAYGKGKLEAEALCAAETSFACPIARCFAFVGPYLPIDSHFAAGNFIRNVILGKNIVIKGDGTPLRSYMYSSDLVLWLLKALSSGKHGRAYNVGSDEAISIADLAIMTRDVAGSKSEIRVLGEAVAGASDRYCPDVSRIKAELGVESDYGLKEALSKTIQWNLSRCGNVI